MTTSAYLETLGNKIEGLEYERHGISRLQEEASRVQKKTYTNWINSHLRKANMEVTDLYKDLQDGTRLLKLMELISRANLGKPNKALLRVQKIENVGRAINFIKSKVQIENIGAEDIVDGNPTLTLGLIWTIILRFQIEEIGIQMAQEESGPKLSGKEALLLWCQNKTKNYPNVNVKDFSGSWRDGLAFAALIHSHYPDKIDIAHMKPNEPIKNLQVAFTTAEKCFDVPQLLDPQDVDVPKPDERSVMTYVSSLYHVLNKKRNQDLNAHRVGKTINQTIDLSSKIQQYEASIQALLKWIRDKTNYFKNSIKRLPPSTKELSQLINQFTQYRRGEKAQKSEEGARLEELLFKIDLLTKELRARPYMPTKADLQLTTLEKAWEALGQSEHAYELALRDAYNRMEKLDQLAKRFNNRAGLLDDWLNSTEKLMEDLLNHPGTQAGAAKKADALAAEVESKGKRFDAMNKISQHLTHAGYPGAKEISDRNGRIQDRWNQVSGPKMKTLLSFLQFPQRRSELLEQMDLIIDRIKELGNQLTTPIKAELESQNAKSGKEPASISYEVLQVALNRHQLAEAELAPLERKLLQIRNSLDQLWHDAPPSPNAGQEREGDMSRSDKSIKLWNKVATAGRERKARLEAMSASYNISVGLAQELSWVNEKLLVLEKTAKQARDTATARNLQLAQRLCKNYETLANEVDAHNPLWEDIKHSAEKLLGSSRDQPADSRNTIKRQLDATSSAWDRLRAEMAKRKADLDECLESAQFYADAEEAKRWIQEKVTLIETAGILTKPLESRNDLDRALKYCGANSSATLAQGRRIKDLKGEMEVFNANDLQRLKYISSLLRKPTDNRRLNTALLTHQGEDDASSDSSIDSAPPKMEPTRTEGSAVVIKSYHAKDPAGRDLSVSKDERVAVIECTNNDWWHVRKTTNGTKKEGFVPANRLNLILAPVLRRESSKKDALLAVKRGVSRGLSMRRQPSARTVNELHFDKDNILLCEKSVMDAYDRLVDLANERGDCLQDTLAWHEFDHKCSILRQWMQKKQEILSAADRSSKGSSSRRGSIDRALDEITATYPLLAEVEELADILTGKIPCKKRKIYQRNDGPLYYKNLAEITLKEIRHNWKKLDKLKRAEEMKRASGDSTSLFDKKADTLELLLGDRIGQLQLMDSYGKDPATNEAIQRQVKGIQMEVPTLEERMRELQVLADSITKNNPKQAGPVQSRMNQVDQLWKELKNLLKEKGDKAAETADTLELRKRLQDLSRKLDDADEQIQHMTESDLRRIAPKDATALECLLPSDSLQDAARKADDVDEALNLYDREAEDLCMRANDLPPECKSKNDMCQAAEGVTMRNEGLKRDLANRKRSINDALAAQALKDNLNKIEARIKEDSVRLGMTEPLLSVDDVDREKRRVATIKLDLERNKAAIDAVEEKLKAPDMSKKYADPLAANCERLRGKADRALKRAAKRDKELEDGLNRVRFHDEVGDLDDWLSEKQAAVQSIRDFVEKCPDDAMPLPQIRQRMAQLQAVNAEVNANEPTLEKLKKTAACLPQSTTLTNFPDPVAETNRLSNNLDNLKKDIYDTQSKLDRAVAVADLHTMPLLAPVVVQPVRAEVAYAAAPGYGDEPSAGACIPRNLAEALAALKKAQNERKDIEDNLKKIQAAEDKAKKAGVLTPALKEKLDRERQRQKARLAQLDDDIKRNEELVAWYKLADKMNDIKGWADATSADLREALDGKQAPRTPHEQNTQRQKHERVCNDIERKEPRVKELLDPKICPMPACLQNAGIPGSDPRPELAESFGELKRLASERSKQLLASVDTTDLLSRLADVAEQINSTTVAVDALVEGQSAFPLASSAKKLKGIEETVQKMEPVINDLSQQVDQKLATMQHDRSPLSKPLKKGRKHVIDALQDLKDRISAAKRSLVLQNRVADFMQLSEDQQEDITKALAFASSANVGSSSDPNRWQVFVVDLPNLLNRIDECIGEGTDLRNDLVQPYGTNAGNVAVMPVRRKKDLSQPENPFNLSPQEFATPLQMEYPLCSEQSAQTVADQVKEQIDSLTRDRQLLQKQVQASEDRKANAKLFSSFNEDWVDIMERIQDKDAHLTALAAMPPKSQSLLKGQVSKHEVLEAEVVHIKQRASEVEQAGSDLLMQLRAPGEGQSGQAQEAQKVRDKLSALEKALQALEDKLAQRRKCLNECDRYLRFCQQVNDFILWCNDLDHEVALTEGAVKASSHIITGAVNRLISPAAPTAGTGLSIDLNQAEQQSSTYERLNDEMRTKWSPLSTALVQQAEDMINLNHYAAADLNAKVEQLLVAQKRAEEGLKSANLRMPQLIDLLHLRREIAALVSQLAAQPARLQALVKECSSSNKLQGGQCDKLTSSAEVETMRKCVKLIERVLQSTTEKEAAVTASANQMINKGHYAAKDIHEGIDQYSKARQNLTKDCADLMASLDRCSSQLTWEEDARDFEGWLDEREAELAELSRPKAAVTTTGDVILEQLNTLKRQETFQNSVSANSSHAEGLIKQAKELIAEENKVTNNPNSAVSQRLAERLERINQRWKALIASCAAIAATLNQSRDLLDYQREAEALERWLRDKDILLTKSDLGSDYDHCISLKDNAKEAAAGKTVNKQTMQAFDDLSRKVSKALRTATGGASSGGAASVAALNQRTADYIDRWTADIQDRWRRIAEQLATYVALLDLASGIHELLSRYNVLLSETQDRKTRAAALDDLVKAQSAAEIQAILRVCARGERDIAAIDDHAHGLAAEAKKTVDRVTASSKDGRLQQFVDNLKRKPGELDAIVTETRNLQERKRELTEAKLTAQEVIENCQDISKWSDALCKELRPQIVGAAICGLQNKLAERLMPKKGAAAAPANDDEEKRKAYISRLRQQLNNYQSEYPVREQQLKHCRTKATPILQNLAAVREPNLANSFGEVKNGTEREMAAAGEALRRAADVMQGLTRQLELEEKRLAFLATGKQEGRRIDMIQQQAVEAAYSALGIDAVAVATKNANGEVPSGETPQIMNGGPVIIPKITNEIQCSAPPIPGQSTMAPKDCLTLLDTLSATLANREDNPLQEKYKELQSYQADPNLSKEAYNEQAVAADKKLYQDTHAKATRTKAILAALKAQVLYQTECENWFQMAADSLDWMNEMQAKVDDTFDWRVTLRRFGVDVKPNQRTTVEMTDGGPKGTGGMSKRLARQKQLAVDITSGLQMVKQLCDKGEELRKTRSENAAKIGDTVTRLTDAANHLHDTCKEKNTRMTEANELVQWGHQMDDASAQATATEQELTVDDYGADEAALSKLLDRQTEIENNIKEVQVVRGQNLLNKATKAQAEGHFAGAQMVQEAQKLNDSLTNVLPQLVAGRKEALRIMLTWRTVEKEMRAESIWLKEKMDSPLLDMKNSKKTDYADASRHLKGLTELAAQVVTKDKAFKELNDKVNGLVQEKQTTSKQAHRKTVQLALGTVGDSVLSMSQLNNQKTELEERIANTGALLLTNYTTLRLLNEINEAEEWIRVRILPLRQIAPMTDSNGTKVASQKVKDMLVDAASFNRDTIGPLKVSVQQVVAQQSSGGPSNKRVVTDTEKRTDGVPGPALLLLMQRHADTMDTQSNGARPKVEILQRETEELTSRYQMLLQYLKLVEKKLQLHTEVHTFNAQADDLNRWLSEMEQSVSSKDYGSDVDECGMLLSSFDEQFEGSSSIGASRLSALGQKSKELLDEAATLRGNLTSEEQRSASVLSQIPDQEGWVSVPQALQEIQNHVKMDEKTVNERQEELNRKWVDIRTGMKTRKEALQSAMQIHKFMSDTEDLLEWILAKSPQARSRNIGIALLGKLSGKTADEEAQKASSLEKARSQQEKLRHEISAMQKQMDKLDREQTRLNQEYPSRAEEVRTRWQAVQNAWDSLRQSVQADKQRLTEAQMVTEWTDRCNLLISWLDERRLAMLAVHVIPTELDEATRVLREHASIKTQLSKRSPEKEAIERSAYELTEKVPSAKIVINQNSQKLATAWTQTHSVWTTRNALYEKNVELRKLLSEMNEIESWLEEQEARLKNLNLASEQPGFNVDKAMKEQDDIERAVEDARQRVEAIKRKCAVENVGFELLKFAAARAEGAASKANSGIISDARVAEIRRRESSKIIQSRPKNANQVKEAPSSTVKDIFGSLLANTDGGPGSSSPQRPGVEGLIKPNIRPVERSAPVAYLQEPGPNFNPGVNRKDSFGMSPTAREPATAMLSPVSRAPVPSTPQPSAKAVPTAAPLRTNSTESNGNSEIGVGRRISSLFSGLRKKSSTGSDKERKASQSSDKTKSATLGSQPVHAGQNRESSLPPKSPTVGQNEPFLQPKSPAVTHNERPAKSPPKGRTQHVLRTDSDVDSADEAKTRQTNTPSVAPPAPSVLNQNANARVPIIAASSISSPANMSRQSSLDVDTKSTGHSGARNDVKCTGILSRKVTSNPKKSMNIFKKLIATEEPGQQAVLNGATLSFYDNLTDSSHSAPTARYDVREGRFDKSPATQKAGKSRRYELKATLADKTEMTLGAQTEEELNKWLRCLNESAASTEGYNTAPSSRHGSLHRLQKHHKDGRSTLDRKHKH